MKTTKNVLIIADNTDKTVEMANGIAEVLKEGTVSLKTISDFNGNDILPADVFFLGCEEPNPASFAYISDLLSHINLAGRSCGIFTSGSKNTAKYLTGLLKDCEVTVNPEPLFSGPEAALKNWVQETMRVNNA